MGFWSKLFMLDQPADSDQRALDDKADRAAIASIRGQPIVRAGHTPCILALVDCSGSMFEKDFFPSRRTAAFQAYRKMVETVRLKSPDSLVGLGLFADGFFMALPPLPVDAHYAQLLAASWNSDFVGGTQMDKGLLGILDMVRQHCPPGLPVVVLMLTDGHHTGRKRDVTNAAEQLKEAGADIWAVGIGGGPKEVDETLLRQIVSRPENYVFIGNWQGPEAIVGTFQRVVGLYLTE